MKERSATVSDVTIKSLIKQFDQQDRRLIRDAKVNEEGHIGINMTLGAHLMCEKDLDTLKNKSRIEQRILPDVLHLLRYSSRWIQRAWIRYTTLDRIRS